MTDKQHNTAARKLMEAMPMRDTPWTDVDAIVAGLSEAQKRALLCAMHDVIPPYYPTALRVSNPTFRALRKHGLTETWPPRLTPLGLAVRAKLEAGNG